LLALAGSSGDAAAVRRIVEPHLAWLASIQNRDGLLIDVAGGPPGFTANGLAACVLPSYAASGSGRTVDTRRLVDALVAVKGLSVDIPDPRQDNKLQGWPWMADTFSWIEPTCWCLLALKKNSEAVGKATRIAEAEKLIANRSCEPGGWNFGNASAVGQDLRPYVPTTALGLIAMQDRRQTPEVARSLAWLRESRLKEGSAVALALTAIALRIYDVPADDVDARLAEDVDRAERMGNMQALAMTLFALTAGTHDARALRV